MPQILDLNLKIQSFTHYEYNKMWEALPIEYDYLETIFGRLNTAQNSYGICHLSFHQPLNNFIERLKHDWPRSVIEKKPMTKYLKHQILLSIGLKTPSDESNFHSIKRIPIILKGTTFQIQVWRELIKIPLGRVCSYSQIAQQINKPKATRAIGNAVGKNPIAILIPCHRVIRKDGLVGEYRWGLNKKIDLLKWESPRKNYKLNCNPKSIEKFNPEAQN